MGSLFNGTEGYPSDKISHIKRIEASTIN